MKEAHSSPEISIVVAMGSNRVIGKDNQLLWHLSPDLKRFKAITSGYPIIMGRKTFESIGKALPGRLNIVISRGTPTLPEGVLLVNSLEDALAAAKSAEKIFIIGGAEIYKLALPKTHFIYLTEVKTSITGHAYFPELESNWEEIEQSPWFSDEKSGLEYRYLKFGS